MMLLKRLKASVKNICILIGGTISGRLHWDYFISQSVNCRINSNTTINGVHYFYNVTVDYGTAIGPNTRISNTNIGKFCSLGPNIVCGWGIHPTNGISTSPAFYSTLNQAGFTYSKVDKIVERKPIYIGNDVFIGANVTILDGVTISDGAVIGAGAVVSKDIPPYAIAVGCPINIISYRFNEETINKLLKLKWWDKDETVYRKVEADFFDVNSFLNHFENL
jgi:virginiamycin A acetyltransferase